MPFPVSREKFATLVAKAAATLPDDFKSALDDVRIEISDRPTPKMLKELEMEDDELLLGLYTGVPLTERSVEQSGRMPDVIYIFQEDCETVSDSEKQLIEEVRVTVLHELGHYFGLDEDEIDDLGYG